MTDFELNKAIAGYLFLGSVIKPLRKDKSEGEIIIESNKRRLGGVIDYCNNWNDLMPLVVKHKLASWQDEATGDWYVNQTMRDDDGDYLCDTFEEDIENESLRHAYAECLLKVLESI